MSSPGRRRAGTLHAAAILALCLPAAGSPCPPGAGDAAGRERGPAVRVSAERVKAVGRLERCSGLMISSRIVLTAAHCEVARGEEFCVGEGTYSDLCATVARVVPHPEKDLALLGLEDDAVRLRKIEPIPPREAGLERLRAGDEVLVAGFGPGVEGGGRSRRLAGRALVAVDRSSLTVGREGAAGACYGDSGGPLLVSAPTGSLRVAGILTEGAPTCFGRDRYTRVDVERRWIAETETRLSPPRSPPRSAATSPGGSAAPRAPRG